ncbi:hypothetical protein HOP52_15140 [Halomonas campisalis]|uniref:Uncharacterized protein n=1 Tax=Billgrantia campisalis TaxID=74661 RepID=A0ABS9PBE2_9GAMM|nr:hypothetical protein [Halomonas campisalis]MCG6659093.1 hypothetical protein [Halomonas campisalis]MDR5863873.1 hypothetical protein [Halomonas campisalis]
MEFSDVVASEWRPFIHLELDSIDVTEMVAWETRSLRYQPVSAMSAGEHELRLMYYGDDGSIEELGYWTFEVRQTDTFKTITLDGNSEVTVNQRLAEHNLSGPPDYSADGYSQWFTELQSDRVRIEGTGELAYANRPEQSITGRRLDMPQFSLLAETERTRVTAGDQRMGQQSLVMDGYQQRGLQGELALDTFDTTFQLFGMSGNRELGIDDGLGLSDPDNRIIGTRWQSQWQPGDTNELQLSATYLTGGISEPDAGSWSSTPTTRVHDGHAWNAVLDGFFLERRLRMRGEHATSRYDFDGRDFGFDAVADSAWSTLVLLDPDPTDWETPLDWQIGAEAQRVGPFYRSLAHSNLPSDLYMRRIFASANRDKWYWDASLALEEDNLDDFAAYATTETRRWNLQLGYDEYEPPEPGSLFALLGQPSYSLSLDRVDREDKRTPPGYLPNDTRVEGIWASAAFRQDDWYWSVDLGAERFSDHTGWQPDSDTYSLGWQLGLELSEHYRINLGWQGNQTRYRDGGERIDQQIFSLGGNGQFVPDRLAGSLNLSLNQNNAEDDPFFPQRDESLHVSGQLDWRIRKPERNRAGLDLSLSYSGTTLRDRLYGQGTLNRDQVWLELRTTLPTAYPGGMQ